MRTALLIKFSNISLKKVQYLLVLGYMFVCTTASAIAPTAPTAAWNTRNTITGRYMVKLAGAAALMPSAVNPYTACPAPGDKNNDEQNRPYANVLASGFQSSTSDVDVDITCGTIKYAYLYWGGGYASASPAITDAQAQTCRLKDKNNVWQNINASVWYKQMWDGTAPTTRDAQPYACFADVTAHLVGMAGGTFAVGDIYTAASASPTGGQLGGWTLVLVYESFYYTLKTIRFWDNMILAGTNGVDPSTNSLNGLTAPPTGSIDAFLGLLSMDGDADKTHTVQVRSNGTGGGTWIPVDNGFPQFFNSAIAEDGIHVPKNMACDNTMGWDAQHVTLPTGTVKNNTTTVDFQYNTNDEVTYLFASYIGVEINEPRLEVTKASSKSSVIFNETYQYTISMNNIGGVATLAGVGSAVDTIDSPVNYVSTLTYVLENNATHATSNPAGIVPT
jgi:hypothetical protein